MSVNLIDESTEVTIEFFDVTGSNVKSQPLSQMRDYISEYHSANGVDLDFLEVLSPPELMVNDLF